MQWKWAIAQRLELWWWKRYLRGRKPEDYLTWKQAYWQRFLDSLPRPVLQAPTRILDAGCGPAGIFMALPEHEVTAFDPLLDQYRTKLSVFHEDRFPNVHFEVGLLEEGLSGNWPVVFCVNAINHVRNWAKALDSLSAMVSTGGWLVVTTDVHRRKAVRNLFRLIPGDMLHPQQHCKEEYVAALRKRGFTIISEEVLTPGRIFDYWRVVAQKNPA